MKAWKWNMTISQNENDDEYYDPRDNENKMLSWNDLYETILGVLLCNREGVDWKAYTRHVLA